MRNFIIRIILFVVCFFGGVIGLNLYLGSDAGDVTSEMDQASLPIIYADVCGSRMNPMHGYTSDIDASLLRDSVTPLEGDQKVKLFIDANQHKLSKLHYEVRSSDSSSLVEDGDITSFTSEEEGDYSTSIGIRMQLKEGQDYILKLVLANEGGVDISYYTHIVYNEEMHVKEHLSYVKDFNRKIFDKTEAESLRQYLESDAAKINNDLGNVDIQSSFEAITFADMKPKKVNEPVPVITDINNDVASMQFSYVIRSGSSESDEEYYNVVEEYKVRYTQERMFLLDYHRTMNALYDRKFTDTGKNALKMGITSRSAVPYIVSDNCKMAAFVKERQLYFYDYQNTQITKVFSFLQENASDIRDNYNQHDISLIQLDSKGNLAFAVYGYMNRGRHEGENGIVFYRYKRDENQIEEIAFIPSRQPYSALQEDMQQVVYINKNNVIYITLNGTFYSVDMKNREVHTIMDGVTGQTVVSSVDRHFIAMQNDSDIAKNKGITVIDLESGEKQQIRAQRGEVLRIVGFVDGDFVYGRVKQKQIVKKDSATIYYPIYKIDIVDSDGNVVKDYKPVSENVRVLSASVKDNVVEMKLGQRSGNGFKEKGSDYIMSKEENGDATVSFNYEYSSTRYNELEMVFPNYIYLTAVPELLVTKETSIDNNRNVEIEDNADGVLRYFVYANGKVDSSYDAISEAIRKADDVGGTVVNSQHKTVWEHSGIREYAEIEGDPAIVKAPDKLQSMQACISMVSAYEGTNVSLSKLAKDNRNAGDLLEEYIKKDSVNLTGCSLDEIRYYISIGHPVIGKNSDGTYVLITSYNGALLRYTDPVTGTVERKNYEQMQDAFKNAGNVFYSYLK